MQKYLKKQDTAEWLPLNVSGSVSCHVPLTHSHSCPGPKYHRRNQPKQGDNTSTSTTSCSPQALLISHCSPPFPLWGGGTTPRGGKFIFGCSRGRSKERGGKCFYVCANSPLPAACLVPYPSACPTLGHFLFPLCLCVLFCQYNDCGEHGER